MSWEAASVVVETIGLAAVVGTLFYLSKEIRQNRISVDTASHLSIADGFNSINLQIAADQTLSDIFFRGMANPESLSPAERSRFVLLGQSYVNQFAIVKNLNDNRAIAPSHFEVFAITFAHMMNSPGGHYISQKVTVPPELDGVVREFKEAAYDGAFSGKI